jgi:hypothetical protein
MGGLNSDGSYVAGGKLLDQKGVLDDVQNSGQNRENRDQQPPPTPATFGLASHQKEERGQQNDIGSNKETIQLEALLDTLQEIHLRPSPRFEDFFGLLFGERELPVDDPVGCQPNTVFVETAGLPLNTDRASVCFHPNGAQFDVDRNELRHQDNAGDESD